MRHILIFLKSIYKISLFLLSRQTRSCTADTNSIIIVKVEGIGDYILFRNFLLTIKQSSKFANYQITLVGNIAWMEIAQNFDSEVIDKFIWLDHKKFASNLSYRYHKLKEIAVASYDYAIYPAYWRETLFGDSIINSITAKYKIASLGDSKSRTALEYWITNHCYNKLLPAKPGIMFEFLRNQEFFTHLLEQEIHTKLHLPTIASKYQNELPKHYVVLFIGASEEYRKWSLSNYIDLAKYLITKHNLNVVLCGTKEDKARFEQLNPTLIESRIFNLLGKTTLIELIDVLAESYFIISNETGIPHIAVALNKKTLVISNANHYGRYTPYPASITTNYFSIYPTVVTQNSNDNNIKTYGYKSRLDINSITVETVIKKIIAILGLT